MSTDISKIFPIQSIEQGFLINGNEDITAGYRIMLPEIFSLSKDEFESINQGFADALCMLPVGVTVHKQDYHYYDRSKSEFRGNDIISRGNDQMNHNKPVLMHYSYLFVTISDRALVNASLTNSFTRMSSYVLKRPFRKITEKAEDVEGILLSLEIGLKSIRGIKIKRMDDTALYCSLFNYFNMSYDEPKEERGENDIIQPLSFRDGTILSGNDRFGSILSLSTEGMKVEPSMPAQAVPAENFKKDIHFAAIRKRRTSITYPVGIGLPVNHIVNTWIKIVDTDALRRKFKAEKAGLSFLYAMRSEAAVKKYEEIDSYLQNSLTDRGEKACMTGVNVIITESNMKELRNSSAIAANAFKKMHSATALKENEQAGKLFFSSCPGNINENHRTFISTVEQSVPYIEKETHYFSEPSGYLLHDPWGKPTKVDMWYSKNLTGNKNELWLGKSGSGKSHLLINLNTQAYMQGEHVIIFENGHSAKMATKMIGGKYFDSSNPASLRYNIFLCRKNRSGKYLYKYDPEEFDGDTDGVFDKVNFIYSVLATIWKKGDALEPEVQEIIKMSIAEFYGYINENNLFPHINEYYRFIDYFKDRILKESLRSVLDFEKFKLMLSPFCKGGRYEYLFDTEENPDIVNDRWVVFDLEHVWKSDPDMFKYLGLIAVEMMLDKERRCAADKKRYVIDEGIDMVTAKETGDHIGALYRKGRKITTKTIFATQLLDFLDDAPKKIKDSITGNSAILVLFNSDRIRSMYRQLREYAELTDEEIEVIESITKEESDKHREFFMRMGTVSKIYINKVSPIANAIFDSRSETIKKVERYFEETGSMHAALRRFVKENTIDT